MSKEEFAKEVSYNGLTFPEARERIQTSLDQILKYFENLTSKTKVVHELIKDKRIIAWVLLSCLVLALYIVSVSIENSSEFQPGLIFTIIIYAILFLFNLFCYVKSYYISQIELSTLITSIILQYKSYLEHQFKSLDASNVFPAIQIPSGHSQVSIVNVYRHNQWIKIPVLLLAEGDIIALMGGDITPCQVYELKVINSAPAERSAAHERHTHHHFQSTKKSEIELKWVKTKFVPPGEKIFIDVEEDGAADIHHDETLNPDDFHLVDHNHSSSNLVQDFNSLKQKLAEGKSSISSKNLDNRHRVLGPESIEVLRLTGNIRCFLVAETPIESYIHSVYQKQLTIAEKNKKTFLHQLKELILSDGTKYIYGMLLLVIILAIIRFIIFPENRDYFIYTLFLPFANILFFVTPVNLPFLKLILESIGIAEILTTLEVALSRIDSSGDNFKSSVGGTLLTHSNSIAAMSAAAANAAGAGGVGGQGTAAGQHDLTNMNTASTSQHPSQQQPHRRNSNAHSPIKNPVHQGTTTASSPGGGPPMKHHHSLSTEDPENQDQVDEFIDEDLDERVDENAEVTAMKVTYLRFFQYVCKVLKSRLFTGQFEKPAREDLMKNSFYSTGNHYISNNNGNFLPIPLASINITEQLGSVTKVCFVDDDIISENYSVTEEIFLLTEDLENANNGGNNNNNNNENENKEAPSKIDVDDKFSSSLKFDLSSTQLPTVNTQNNNNKAHIQLGSGSYTKGTVLDLHANPEATGSRFENPLWWKFLPCLKPLGLNALLTYKHTAEDLVSADELGPSLTSLSSSSLNNARKSFVSLAQARDRSLSSVRNANSNQVPVPPSSPTPSTHHSKQKSALHEIERALVRHIRKTMPLEFLRELAEEIGFGYEDLNIFSKAVEVNVIAPGLQNAHLLEDNHVWGQDETRRRGSLMPNLRGAVYRDSRGGGLQMMSIGDPSLILNYCREYWDGNTKSITPLSSVDRTEVLNVYERWKLEDFDVVAFSYSPMPVPPLLYFLSNEMFGGHHHINGMDGSILSKKSLSNFWNQSLMNNNQTNDFIPKVPTVFFVDPSTPNELIGGKLKKKNARTSGNNLAGLVNNNNSAGAGGNNKEGDKQNTEGNLKLPKSITPFDDSANVANQTGFKDEAPQNPIHHHHFTVASTSEALEMSDSPSPVLLERRTSVSEKIPSSSASSLLRKRASGDQKEQSPNDQEPSLLTFANLQEHDQLETTTTTAEQLPPQRLFPAETESQNNLLPPPAPRVDDNNQDISPLHRTDSMNSALSPFHQLHHSNSISNFNGDKEDTTLSMVESLMAEEGNSSPNQSLQLHHQQQSHHLRGNRGLRRSISDSNLTLKNAMKNLTILNNSQHEDDHENGDNLSNPSDSMHLDGSIDTTLGSMSLLAASETPGTLNSPSKKFLFPSVPVPNKTRAEHISSSPVLPEDSQNELNAVNSTDSPNRPPTLSADDIDGGGGGVHNVLHQLSQKQPTPQQVVISKNIQSVASGESDLTFTLSESSSKKIYPAGNNKNYLPVSTDDVDVQLRYSSLQNKPLMKIETIDSYGPTEAIDLNNQEEGHLDSRLQQELLSPGKDSIGFIEEEDFSIGGLEGEPLVKSLSLNEGLEGLKKDSLLSKKGYPKSTPTLLFTRTDERDGEDDEADHLLSPVILDDSQLNEDEDDDNPLFRAHSTGNMPSTRNRSKTFASTSSNTNNNNNNNVNTTSNANNNNINNNVTGSGSSNNLSNMNSIGLESKARVRADSFANDNPTAGSSKRGSMRRNTEFPTQRHHQSMDRSEPGAGVDDLNASEEDAEEAELKLNAFRERGRSQTSANLPKTKSVKLPPQANDDNNVPASSTNPNTTAVTGNVSFQANLNQSGHSHHHHRRSSLQPGESTTSKSFRAGGAGGNSSRNNAMLKQRRRAALKELWSLMRQQIFVGMVASSVPVRRDVTNTKEDLDIAGIRFVYFSAQNMKRSKPVAEKIGIPFDWNCAISLRNLETNDKPDPHRHISNYADWDVLARMPHGIEAIRNHIKEVDNVPLLVSLFTDATPETIEQMIEIFRENGETVLSIGSGYRCYNQNIYSASNLATSVSVLPNVRSFLPAYERDLYDLFPVFSNHSMTKSDLKLSFDLVGLSTINLLQAKCFYSDIIIHRSDWNSRFDESNIDHLKLPVLLETIRKGRVLLLNELQYVAFYVMMILSLCLWQVISYAIPISIPPYCPPAMSCVFYFFYLPCLIIAMIFTDDHEGIMKNTPRKTMFIKKPKDEKRIYWYLSYRVGMILFSIWITGYLTTVSLFQKDHNLLDSFGQFHRILNHDNQDYVQTQEIRSFWLIQDMMVNAAFCCMIVQSFSMLVRGQQFRKDFPWPWDYVEYYVTIFFLICVHFWIMFFRAMFRTCTISGTSFSEYFSGIDCPVNNSEHYSGFIPDHQYNQLHYSVWIVFIISIGLNLWIGFYVNQDDYYHYRRYLQFLRLEFDTRLGMHSPR